MNLKSKEKACVVAKQDRIRIEIGMISNLKTLLIKFLTSNSPIFAKNGNGEYINVNYNNTSNKFIIPSNIKDSSKYINIRVYITLN